jgi:hypothetical protein
MFDLNSRGFLLTASRGERRLVRRLVHARVSVDVGIKKVEGDEGDDAKGGTTSGDSTLAKYSLSSDKGELVRIGGSTRGKFDDSLDSAQVRALVLT